jgi:YVTN family beta-propeller protein
MMGPRRLGPVLAALVLGVGCRTAPASPAPGPGAVVQEAGDRVYVANQDDATVTVVDAGTFEVVTTVDLQALGFGANAKPHHVAVEPDGSHWYLSLIGANRVLKLDRANRVVGSAEFEVPGMLALDPSSDRLYVGRSMSAVNPPRRIGVIDRRDMSVEEIPVLYPRPHALAVDPAAAVVYSASLAENRMAVIVPDEEDVELLDLPGPAHANGHAVHTLVQWAVSPDGRTLVGTGEMSGELLVFDIGDPLAPEPVAQVPVEARPWHPAFTPDGGEVWFANKGANAVTVVDTRSWTVDAVVVGDGLAEPHGLALSPDGRSVFVSSNNLGGTYPGGGGTLVVIDRAERAIVRVIEVGRNAAGVGAPAGTDGG